MKYYKLNNGVYAYELDGSQDHLIGDKVAMTAEEVEAHLNPPKTAEQIKASIISAVQAHLDSQAQSKGYDSILSATSYAGYPNYFQAEGIAFCTWRANVWKYCYQQLAEIESGERPIIPTVEEFIAELPTL